MAGPSAAPTPPPQEPRETSGGTTRLIIRYVRRHGGEAAVDEVLRRAACAFTATELEQPSRWIGYDLRIRLFEAATDVLGEPATCYRIGATSLTTGLSPSMVLLVRAFGSPAAVFRQLPRTIPKFSTTSTMEVLDCGTTSATLRYRLHDGYRHSRRDCEYAQGLFSVVPVVFGRPPARVVHDECESDGYAACVYHVSWSRGSRLPWRQIRATSEDAELVALRGQLEALQQAATDLVSAESLDGVLDRIIERAASAVVAPGYLLALVPRDGEAPTVRSSGVPDGQAGRLARALLAGEPLGTASVVVDVATRRRFHGRLAMLYPGNARGMLTESSLLAAYAGHAAAALDLLLTLEESRRETERARSLLQLARDLARARGSSGVSRVVAAALPTIVGSQTGTVLLWDGAAQALRAVDAAGFPDDRRQILLDTPIDALATPELLEMLADREPRLLIADGASVVLAQLLRVIGLESVIAVPMQAGGEFLGVATAGWSGPGSPHVLQGELLDRLRGVGDSAATALQNARLLDAVRHQAMHDPLTGLPNRTLFADRLTHELAAARRGSGGVSVAFCDVDHFKTVNDTLGHAAGDELLRQVARRLRDAVRPGDTVARLSGDEFALVLPGVADDELAGTLAARVVGSMRSPFLLDGRDIAVTASIGVGVHAGGAAGPEDLLRAADRAMYTAKQRGRDGYAVTAVRASGSRHAEGVAVG